MADFTYIDKTGGQKTIQAADANTALGLLRTNTALNADPKSGVMPTANLSKPSVQTSDLANKATTKATQDLTRIDTATQAKKVTGSVTNADGSVTTTYADGSTSTSSPKQQTSSTNKALSDLLGKDQENDPIKNKIVELDAGLDQTKNSIDTMLTTYNADVDAQTTSMIDNIKNIYAGRIDEQKKINQAMIGSTNVSGIVSGRSRYASTIQDSILSAEETAGLKRIKDLEVEMANLINTAKSAASDKKSEMLYKQMERYDKAKQEHAKAVQDQLKYAMDLEKLALEKSAEQRQLVKDDISNMENTAQNLVSGIVDLPEKEMLTAIKELSDSYGVDQNFLITAVNKAKQDQFKDLPNSIAEYEYAKSNYGYKGSLFDFKKAQTSASKIASGNTNMLTAQEARDLGIDSSYVGMTDAAMVNELNQSTPPKWFIDMVKKQEGVDLSAEGAPVVWENFRNSPEMMIYRSQSYKPDTKGETFTGTEEDDGL